MHLSPQLNAAVTRCGRIALDKASQACQLPLQLRELCLNIFVEPLALHIFENAAISCEVSASRLSNTLVKEILTPLAFDLIACLVMSAHLRFPPASRRPV